MLARYSIVGYFSGAAIARTADEMSAPALLLLGLAVYGTTSQASLLYGALTIAAAVGGPMLGVLLDRASSPGRFLAGCLLLYSVGLGGVGLTLGHIALPLVIGLALLAGLLAPALSGGWTSLLADLVPASKMPRAHAMDATGYNVASLAGPALTAVIAAAAGAGWAVAVAVALLGAAAVPAWVLPLHRGAPVGSRKQRGGVAGDVRAGLSAIATVPGLRRIMIASCTAHLSVGMFLVACPLLGREHLGGASRGALLLSVLAAASLAATAALARWPLRWSPEVTFVLATAVAGTALLLIGFIPTAAGVIAAVALLGTADGPQLVALFAIRHRDAPLRLRGRIFTTAASLKISAAAIGSLMAGVLGQHSTTLLLSVAAFTQLLAVVALHGRRRSTDRTSNTIHTETANAARTP